MTTCYKRQMPHQTGTWGQCMILKTAILVTNIATMNTQSGGI